MQPVGRNGPEDVFMTTILEVGRRMRQRLPGDELDYSLLPVLWVLCDGGPARHTALAERLLLDASTVSRKVHHLEDLGLVRVSPDENDARARQVELLPAGRDALDDLRERRRDVIAGVLADWPESDRAQLHRLLQRFNDDLTDSGDPAARRRQEVLS